MADNDQDVSDTLGEMREGNVKEALHNDYEATKEDVKEGAEKVKDTMSHVGKAVEKKAEQAGLNEGDPNNLAD